MSNDKAIATRNDDVTAQVVDSVVLKGDISGLSAGDRARYYISMCDSLGLNPSSQPFAILRLNGKEVLYATRGASDQLAKVHNLTREITDGPRVMDCGGSKLIYALCKATLPSGRFETATSMVPLPSGAEAIGNAFLKCETKAKRRATLSILGLGMLDETEIETIPASAKSEATPIDLNAARESTFVQRIHAIAESAYGNASLTAEQAVAVYYDALDEVGGTVSSDDEHDGVRAAQSLRDKSIPLRVFNELWNNEHARRSAPSSHDVLLDFRAAVNEIELPAEAVAVWIKYRDGLAKHHKGKVNESWKRICERIEALSGVKNAKVWLKRAVELEDARREKTTSVETTSEEPANEAQPVEADVLTASPMDAFKRAIDAAERINADEIARAYVETRPLRLHMTEGEREKAWQYVQEAYGTLVKARDAIALRNMLKANIARHEPTDGPRGGGTPRPTAPENTNATGDAVDTTTTASAVARWKGHLLGSHAGSVHAMANSLAKHRYDHGIPLDEMVAATVDVMTAQLVPVDGRSVRLSRADAERMCREALERAEKRAA